MGNKRHGCTNAYFAKKRRNKQGVNNYLNYEIITIIVFIL